MGNVPGGPASTPLAAARLIPQRLRAFAVRYPRVRATLLEGTDQEVRAWLEQGAADVAVVTLPAAGLEAVPLADDEMVAVLPVAHALAAGSPVSLCKLAVEPFILSTGGCEPLINGAARRVGVLLHPAYEAREAGTILAMVRADLGVSVLPTLALPDTLDGIVTRSLDPPLPRHLGLAVRARVDASPAAVAFMDVAVP